MYSCIIYLKRCSHSTFNSYVVGTELETNDLHSELSLRIRSHAPHTVKSPKREKRARRWPPGQLILRDHFLEARAPKKPNRLQGVFKGSRSNYISSFQLAGSLLRSTYLGYSAPFKGWKLEEMKRAKIRIELSLAERIVSYCRRPSVRIECDRKSCSLPLSIRKESFF